MIVLDTNVVSELMRQAPDLDVLGWLDSIPARETWITTISIFELRFGIALQASEQRRSQLEESLAKILNAGFSHRVLDLDVKAANSAAVISAEQRSKGQPKEIRDTFIAGIVVSRNAELATRNVRHFRNFGFRVIDPWSLKHGQAD